MHSAAKRALLAGVILVTLVGCSHKIGADVTNPQSTETQSTKAAPTTEEVAKYTNLAKTKLVRITTAKGSIDLELYPDDAPVHVANFMKLTEMGFYNGLTFHRVEPGFVVQGGDPSGDGTGGPGYTIDAEFNDRHHAPGILAMARAQDPNSAGSQFYITLADAGFLDKNYTVFGGTVAGFDVVQKIARGDVMEKVEIVEKPTATTPSSSTN